ncbi:MAG: Na+/H+ antiporter subunit E [Lachnospiraceae bacterium]|nr:Na+/H+ antiporter subunit E [Lachnospiraceae bacterium]
MFFVYLALWIIFNGRVSLQILVSGVILAAALYAFTCAFMGYSPKKELAVVKKIPAALFYVLVLLVEVFKANFKVLFFIYTPKYEVEPKLVSFKTDLKSEGARTALANSITLTPGTITVSLDEDNLVVHALDSDMAKGLKGSDMEKRLIKIENIGRRK